MNAHNELSALNMEAIEALYKKYKEDPESVDESFRYFFQGFDLATSHYPTKPTGTKDSLEHSPKELAVMHLITGYRRRGHLFTKTNPVRTRRSYSPTLAIENFNLTEQDLDTRFEAGKEIGLDNATLREIIAHLEETYCKSIGVEYRYMTKPEIVQCCRRKWSVPKPGEAGAGRKASYSGQVGGGFRFRGLTCIKSLWVRNVFPSKGRSQSFPHWMPLLCTVVTMV